MAASTYTFHVAPGAEPDDPGAAERAPLVRDGFSWGAFLVPMLWFFSHRHWLAGLGALAVVAVLALVLRLAGFGTGTIVLAEILLHLLIGLEGASLRRWLLARRGRPVADIVQAGSHEEAEVKGFARWVASGASPAYASGGWAGASPMRREPEQIIGLFPDLEGRQRGLV